MSELLAKSEETTWFVYFWLLESSPFGPGGSLTPVRVGGRGEAKRCQPPSETSSRPRPSLRCRAGMEECSAEHEAEAEVADRRTARGGKVEIIKKILLRGAEGLVDQLKK